MNGRPARRRYGHQEHAMPQYLLSLFQPGDTPPPPGVLGPIIERLDAFNAELRAADSWVFAGGLHPQSTATVLRYQDDGEVLMTDGPFAEAKEFLGGISIIDAPALAAALEWGRKLSRAVTLPVEVRPSQGS